MKQLICVASFRSKRGRIIRAASYGKKCFPMWVEVREDRLRNEKAPAVQVSA